MEAFSLLQKAFEYFTVMKCLFISPDDESGRKHFLHQKNKRNMAIKMQQLQSSVELKKAFHCSFNFQDISTQALKTAAFI